MAAFCAAAVLGFLAVAIFLLGNSARAEAVPTEDSNMILYLSGVVLLVLVIALRAEAWVIKIRNVFTGRAEATKD